MMFVKLCPHLLPPLPQAGGGAKRGRKGRLTIIVITANLARATFLALKATWVAPVEYCLLLLLDLIILSVWALAPHPARLWGVWLTALRIAAAIAWELITRAMGRLQHIGAPALRSCNPTRMVLQYRTVKHRRERLSEHSP